MLLPMAIRNKQLLLVILLACLLHPGNLNAQSHDSTANKKLRKMALITGASYTLAMVGLNEVWYSDFPRGGFHFFNDNKEWKQLDKVGHFYSAFHISNTGIRLLQKSGIPSEKAYLWGGLLGVMLLTPIEILDGFSEEYGASWGDVAANTAGSALALGQYLLWEEVRIKPKYSFSQTSLAAQRPNILGRGLHEEFIKDYNGQTYWLSVDVHAFSKQSKFPKWLNLALGYGAHNMIFANDANNLEIGLQPYRQYYLAIDFDLSYIKSHSKFVNTLLYVVDLIHLPAPTLEYNKQSGWKLHALMF